MGVAEAIMVGTGIGFGLYLLGSEIRFGLVEAAKIKKGGESE